ncbi:MAG: hypothetical protein P8X51_01210 [Maritimibacter sp.]
MTKHLAGDAAFYTKEKTADLLQSECRLFLLAHFHLMLAAKVGSPPAHAELPRTVTHDPPPTLARGVDFRITSSLRGTRCMKLEWPL